MLCPSRAGPCDGGGSFFDITDQGHLGKATPPPAHQSKEPDRHRICAGATACKSIASRTNIIPDKPIVLSGDQVQCALPITWSRYSDDRRHDPLFSMMTCQSSRSAHPRYLRCMALSYRVEDRRDLRNVLGRADLNDPRSDHCLCCRPPQMCGRADLSSNRPSRPPDRRILRIC